MQPIVPPLVSGENVAGRIRAEPEVFLRECVSRHGPVFTVLVDAGKRITYVLDPHMFQTLLTAPQVDFSPVSRQSKLRFGMGGVVSTMDDVRELSTGLIKSLRGQNLTDSLTRFDAGLHRAVAAYTADLDGECPRTIQQLAHQTLIPATVHALFGAGVYDERFIHDFLTYSSSVSTRFAGSDPSLDPRGIDAERALMARLESALERKETPVVQSLSTTLLGRVSLTQDERVRTLLMLMWGSMVNLIPTSVWMYANVIRDAALVEELHRSGGSHLRQSVVTETLRLYSRPNMYREIAEDFDLELSDGRSIHFTGGDWIALFPRFLHHDSEVYQEPLHFDPRRFCPEKGSDEPPTFYKAGEPIKHSTVVFGLGRGRCPGDTYAIAVLERLLAAWTASFDARLSKAELPGAITDTVSSTPGPASAIEIFIQPRAL
jgi:cytochrome P450